MGTNTGGMLNPDRAMNLPQKARSNRLPEAYRQASQPAIDPARLVAANINPTTLLATDYLNHFNEASMMLQMLPEIPDCITDLVQWRPLTYAEHFAESTFRDRELAIAAHERADPAVRRRLDELADEMNAILGSTIDAVLDCTPLRAVALIEETSHRLRPLVAQAAAVINGSGPSVVTDAEADAHQAAVDALFEH
jgi:hypothetical protein